MDTAVNRVGGMSVPDSAIDNNWLASDFHFHSHDEVNFGYSFLILQY